ncbi:type II toxin-antitoxin system VapC family toxin [Terriglobus sp.]|uniref:type II toxin-antitoxin system VapC family toxin n=1 Tax=Terriglobus sp. TaxID=1889013 RepID=UPI003B00E31B
MRILADTHVLVWLAQGDARLSPAGRSLLDSLNSEVYFSLESLREIAIKSSLKRPDFYVDMRELYAELRRSGWKELPISVAHILALAELPNIHRDPFDRMLVAQSRVEGLTLLTADSTLQRYPVSVIAL